MVDCPRQVFPSTESLDLLALAASLMLEDCDSEEQIRSSGADRLPVPVLQFATTGSRIDPTRRHAPKGPATPAAPKRSNAAAPSSAPTTLTSRMDEKHYAAELLLCSETLEPSLLPCIFSFDAFPKRHSEPGGGVPPQALLTFGSPRSPLSAPQQVGF